MARCFVTSQTSKLILLSSLLFSPCAVFASDDGNITRRNFFQRLADSYREGRAIGQAEKEIERRMDAKLSERMRRRLWLERNISRLVDGKSTQWRRRGSIRSYIAIAGVTAIAVYCYTHKCLPQRKDDE